MMVDNNRIIKGGVEKGKGGIKKLKGLIFIQVGSLNQLPKHKTLTKLKQAKRETTKENKIGW